MDDRDRIRPWQLVSSAAGRDEGQAYLVLRVGSDGFVELVDGQRRRLDTPKRKNARHLLLHQHVAADLAERTGIGGGVKNAEVRAALEQLVAAAGLDDRHTSGSGQDAAADDTSTRR